jgi:hypothetical protein
MDRTFFMFGCLLLVSPTPRDIDVLGLHLAGGLDDEMDPRNWKHPN